MNFNVPRFCTYMLVIVMLVLVCNCKIIVVYSLVQVHVEIVLVVGSRLRRFNQGLHKLAWIPR